MVSLELTALIPVELSMLNINQLVTSIRSLYMVFPMFFLYVVLVTYAVGEIKTGLKWQTGYTRKCFHFAIFTAAAVIHLIWSLPGVMLFGMLVTIFVLWACLRGNRSAFYQAIARPHDAPRQTFFIILPLISTAMGGFLSARFFHEYAVFGYLVTGWGDASAEPVGTRWGIHTYRVPSLCGIRSVRSLEGSVSVLITGFIACFLLGKLLNLEMPDLLVNAAVCAATGTIIESISNHGLDNLTIQIGVSGIAYLILT
jgi:phytol kinase